MTDPGMPPRVRGAKRPVQVASSVPLFTTGASRFDWLDPYHLIATMSWPAFFACFIASELLINSAFAVLYIAVPGAIANVPAGSFVDAFFFSIETLATVGYGSMVPASRYGHVISAIEILCGVIYTAVVTGVIFIRFSKPKAKVVYADQPVVANHNGCPTLMIRIANGRTHMLTDASVRLTALMAFTTPEGQQFRRMQTLELAMSQIPMFALTWTLMHPLDAKSPLYGHDAESMISNNIRLMLSFAAHDPTLSVEVHDLKSYAADAIAFGMRYADAIFFDAEGRTLADIRRCSLIEADQSAPLSGAQESSA